MKLAQVFSNYFAVRSQLIESVKTLSPEQLDWTVPNHPNSIGRLLAHIADTEFFWIGCVARGCREKPDFSRFEQARHLDELLALLEQQHAEFSTFLEEENLDDWDDVFYELPQWVGEAEKFSKRWLVWHVVEHQARHRGQIFMLMRMQGLEVPHV